MGGADAQHIIIVPCPPPPPLSFARSCSHAGLRQSQVVDTNKEARDAACREALVLLAEEQAAFEAWRDSLETVPTIKALRTKAEDIRQAEFEKVRSGWKPECGVTCVVSTVERCLLLANGGSCLASCHFQHAGEPQPCLHDALAIFVNPY